MKRASAFAWALAAALGCGETQTPPASSATPEVAHWDDAATRELRTFGEATMRAWQAGDIDTIRNGVAGDGFLASFDLDMMGKPIKLSSRDELVNFAETMIGQMKQSNTTMKLDTRMLECRATATFGGCAVEFDMTMKPADGQPMSFALRGTALARKGADGWKNTHWHASLAKLPEPPAPPPLPAPPVFPAAALNPKDLQWMDVEGLPGFRIAPVWIDPASGASAAFFQVPKKFKMGPHLHTANAWSVILKGSITHTGADGVARTTKAGGYEFMPQGELHTTEFKNGGTLFMMTDGALEMVPVDESGTKGAPMIIKPIPRAAKK
ncbi:MAG: DUF4437 domain-containing protein [Myxococcota bacterium]